MAQYDLLLTQNTAPSGVEFTEKYVNIPKGGILTAITGGDPTVLPVGADTYILVADSAQATGIKWQANSAGHTQGTDTGTTNTTFAIDSDGYNLPITAESASKLGIKVAGGATYADIQAKDATFNKVTVAGNPSGSNEVANKAYVDALLASNDAMVFKGSIGTAGTITGAAFSALTAYNAGDAYKIITAGSYTCKDGSVIVADIGDLFIATADRSGSGWVAGDWISLQTNIDGAVVGPVSAVDNYPALFNGATGKLIKAGSGVAGSMIYETAANYVLKAAMTANSILFGNSSAAMTALTVAASTIVGRKASGEISAMTKAEALAVLNVADGAQVNPSLAAAADINTGTDNAKMVTALAIAGSTIAKGPASSVANRIAIFSGTTGKLLADGGKLITDMMENWVTAPATKTSTGTAGQKAYDSNFFYVCTATNIWKRYALATNW